MKIIATTSMIVCLLLLGGCMDKKDQMQAVGPVISNSPVTKGDLDGKLADVVDLVGKRMDTSQTAVQQNMQSVLGVSVGKLSDDLVKMQVQFKSLADVNAKLQADVNAQVASGNELRIMLKNQMDFNAQLVASVKLTATIETKMNAMAIAQTDMQAKMEAFGAAQAGIGNKIEQSTSEMKQAMTAGHDVNSTNTQFTKEMLQALQSANQTTSTTSSQWAWVLMGVISALSSIGMAYLHYQKKGAETRAMKAEERSMEAHKKVERALMVMTGSEELPKA
jgi:hypothetical protein